MRPAEEKLQHKIEQQREKNSLRTLKTLKGIDFSSNDYLGFAKSPAVLEIFKQKISSLEQLGSTGSRLLSGHHQKHLELEERLANLFHVQAALLFSSGYILNLGPN
jgi:8-amino-7-oxononanoate synthase